ncbi:MAG: hypothetical protein SGI77_25295 [Pirellulaceae bacterium]|nr:hypothetical protein [Pirellulaceae bacterium]
MNRSIVFAVFLAFITISIGCTPRVRVRANPTIKDPGIRYYRPKPYLFVSSVGEKSVTNNPDESTTTVTKPDPKYVNLQLQYLPDFSEEYAVDVRTGFGTADVSLTLEDGWNLTGINQKLDSKTAENIAASAELLKGIASVASPGIGGGRSANGATASAYEMRIAATNVPLGYYESVIGRDSCGRKHLYGFRYIGFMPFQGCPVAMSGREAGCCQSTDLYGLVFENGVMMFKSLNEVAAIQDPSRMLPVETGSAVNDATVTRSLTYQGAGDPKTTTITVQDSFNGQLEADGTLRVGIPKMPGQK